MMDDSDDSYLDALVAAREVEDCGSAWYLLVILYFLRVTILIPYLKFCKSARLVPSQ